MTREAGQSPPRESLRASEYLYVRKDRTTESNPNVFKSKGLNLHKTNLITESEVEMWVVEMIGMKRRSDTTYYAGYSSSGELVEFTLRADALPSVVGKIRKAVENRKSVGIDVNDVEKHRAIRWAMNQRALELLWANEPEFLSEPESKPEKPKRKRRVKK